MRLRLLQAENDAASAQESHRRVRVSLNRFSIFRGVVAAAEEFHVQRYRHFALFGPRLLGHSQLAGSHNGPVLFAGFAHILHH
jgi:hypothetical protein